MGIDMYLRHPNKEEASPMMKRAILLLLALMLLAVPAHAEDPYAGAMNALYRIVLRTENEEITLGSGLLFMENTVLLTTDSCCAAGDLYAIGRDGEHAVLFADVAGDSGAALLQLATPSAATPIALSQFDTRGIPYLFGVDHGGEFRAAPLYQGLRSMFRGKESLLLSSEEGMMPGAFILDENGCLMGLVVAQQMEGIGMYNALEPGRIYNALTAMQYADQFLPIACEWQDGVLNISWEDEERTDGAYIVTISGDQNNYYTFYEAKQGASSIQAAVPPGHLYYMQVQWAKSADEAIEPVWAAMSSYAVPEEQLTEFGFTNECYLASVPAGTQVNSVLPPLEFVSVDTMTDESTDLYLQIKNTYDVSETIERPMTLEFIGPDGQFFYETSGYVFAPEYETADHFALNLEALIASFTEFTSGRMLSGEYKLRYAIGGKVGGEYAFTVQPAGTQAPAAAEMPVQGDSGYLKGFTAAYEKGCVRVDWSGCTVPEGAKVTAYILHDDNPYFTFYEINNDQTFVDFHAIPGKACMVWVSWSRTGRSDDIPTPGQDSIVLLPDEALPYTAFGFTNVRCGLTFTDSANAEAEGLYLPQVPLTRENLTNPDLHLIFQTEDTYQVDGESLEHPLSFVLFTPEGYSFVMPGYYNFAPEYAASDLWLRTMDELVSSYVSFVGESAWGPGEYVFGYFIDGCLAGEITFTLE